MPDLDDTSAQSGTDDATASGGSDQASTDGNTDAGSTDANADKPAVETVTRAEFDAVMARMKAADQRASAREAELKQLRDKDLPEAEKAKKEFEEAVTRAQKAETELRATRITNAFLKDNTYRWKDSGAALKLVDLDGVDISDSGEVTGLKDALKRLAQAHPWMLEEKGADDGKSGGGTGAGAPPMNGKGGTDKADGKKLAQRLPAMRTRVRPQ